MKLRFKNQQYQTDAAKAVTDVFEGQPNGDPLRYTRDLGTLRMSSLFELSQGDEGYGNAEVKLSQAQLLKNVQAVQARNRITQSESLSHDIGCVELDVEMETGTGKTYVYTKTMFELNKLYGWTKFIIVVPSIAIREGVNDSFEATKDHFFEQYGKTIHFFIYDSHNLNRLDEYSQSNDIQAMIINMQAFNTSMKEGGRSKDSRIMYSERDEFGSRRPIDVIAANHPIVIQDEPQKMGGKATQSGIKRFKPLFCINYSATHRVEHNKVYMLDAVDAYQQRLVKRIEVKGFELKNMRADDGYLFLQDFNLSKKHAPEAVIEFKRMGANGSIRKVTQSFRTGDNIYSASAATNSSNASSGLEAYRGYQIAPDGIQPEAGTVRFLNGVELHRGEVYGDSTEDDMRRVQIRETIRSHFEKEQQLFERGIKCLTLFFIDEVAKYRQYDDEGNELTVGYGKIFEEEYEKELDEVLNRDLTVSPEYRAYLMGIKPHETHKGYFSVDKKGRSIDSRVSRGSEDSDDESAYDLILKNKERLLSFEEPTRFIFSHSALREGWDNPNIFQICTLKHSDSETGKRQEVGRGLRLCVNQNGDRQDESVLGGEVQQVNVLTVIASESYKNFTESLQKDIASTLHERPTTVTESFLENLTVSFTVGGASHTFTKDESAKVCRILIKNNLIDDDGLPTDEFKENGLEPYRDKLPEEIRDCWKGIEAAVRRTYDPHAADGMISDGNKKKIQNKLNGNWKRKEFQTLWNWINKKHAYTAEFDDKELEDNAVKAIDRDLRVNEAMYTLTVGQQKVNANREDLKHGEQFAESNKRTSSLDSSAASAATYDLLGEIAGAASITRRSAANILRNIRKDVFGLYKKNPAEFISNVSALIIQEKAKMIVDHISYHRINGEYDSSIFTTHMPENLDSAVQVTKGVQDYVFPDSDGERQFSHDLDTAEEVAVFAKLPRGFKIPTPVGNYAPDWAIAFNEGTVRHVYFVAETKGTLGTLELRDVEKGKIGCAEEFFKQLQSEKADVYYHQVTNYGDLMNIVKGTTTE